VSITDLLAQPLEEVRERFNIAAPARYQEAHRILHEEGHDPHEVMEKAA
jgi:hypothetical protein